MKLTSIQMALLDMAFDRLEHEAGISIVFSVCFPGDSTAGGKEFVIHSVNGCDTAEKFRRHTGELLDEMLFKIHQEASRMGKDEGVLFAIQACERLASLRNAVRFERSSKRGVLPHKSWIFSNPSFCSKSNIPLPNFALNSVLRLTSPYAFAWKSLLSACAERLRDVEFYLRCFGNKPVATAAEVPSRYKLMIDSAVPELACFMFAAHEAGLVRVGSKQELYRLCSEMFSTERAQVISPKSFRNHYDYPTPEALRETKNNLHLMLSAINKRLNHIEGTAALAIVWLQLFSGLLAGILI